MRAGKWWLAIAALALGPAAAVEGMWQPAQLPELKQQLRGHGLAIDPSRLADLTGDPMGAITSLGFCTASFVSPQGLVVTNHHCAYGMLQYNSTPESNLIDEGFHARTRAQELPADPTQRIYVTEQISDVTDRITAGLSDGMDGLARHDAIEAAIKEQVAACESPGYRCDVYSFYGGHSYQLIRQLEIRDVRLVHAPAGAIGKYGGDIDNWLWPRHTGDFAFLRAYVAKDGSPADYAADNVPFRPRHVLKLNPKGVQAGDFVMVAGYPGRTSRHLLADEVLSARDWRYPRMIRWYEDRLAIIDDASRDNEDIAVKYASTVASLNNGLKNAHGQLEGFAKADIVAVKRARETELAAWLDAQGDAQHTALHADMDALRKLVERQQLTRERDLAIGMLNQSALLGAANRIVRLAHEREKPDAQRETGYQVRDEPRIEGSLKQLQRRMDPRVDARFLTHALQAHAQLPVPQQLPALTQWLDGAQGEAAIAARVDALFAASKLADSEPRLDAMRASSSQLADSDDALLELAVQLLPQLLQVERAQKEESGQLQALRPRYMEALLAWNRDSGKPTYPDANGSLRVSFGNVGGYRSVDGMAALPFTTAPGILAKDTGVEPFDSPAEQLEQIRAGNFGSYASERIGSLPVNFLADLDITGGNSGSPILDGNGQLVGLAFDGNWESVSSDWLFNPSLTRAINVDVRYMLWVMDYLDHADSLLKEMGLQPQR